MADTKTYTTNYNLEKPGQDDFYDVAIFNANSDKIDTELKAAATRDTTHRTAATLDHPDNSVTDTKIGNRTANQNATITSTLTGTITQLFSMVFTRIKQMMGTTNFYDAVPTTLTAAKAHMDATSGAHAASAISCTATGDVSAPTVQGAIAELAAQKLPARNSFNSLLCFYRDLAGYSSGTTLVTGAIKVLLPINWGNTMMSIEISGYHNGTNPQSFNVQLAAYARALSSEWQVPTALVTPGSPFTSIRFAYDSVAGRPCILLGTTASNWSNLYLVVKEMVAGQSTVTSYGSGWEVSLITSETGITGIVTAAIKPLLSTANALAGNTIYKYRDVAAYHSGSTTLTGTAKITLPASWLSTTLILEIEGWNSAGTNSSHWETTASGFSNSGGMWQLPAATLSPNCPFSSVRLGFDSVAGKCCVLLGTTTTAWDNVKIAVKGVLAGHNNVSSYDTGWDISVITTETGITNIVTPTVKTIATVEGTAPIAHATAAATYGLATAALYGHVMASSANPLMDGIASAGTDNGKYAREAHIHPTDTSRAPLASPTFTGVAAAVTAALGTNTTQIATTAFVQAALAAVNGKVVAFNLGASGGYVAWDFGLILQWGKYTNTSGNVIATVTLPINYTNSYIPIVVPRGSNYYTGNSSAYADVVSVSQVKLVLDEDNGGPSSDLFWFTIGF